MQGQGQLQPPFGTQHQSDRRSSADFFNTVDDESEMGVADDSGGDDDDTVDWKRRAMALKRKVKELEGELKAVKRRVLDAVM